MTKQVTAFIIDDEQSACDILTTLLTRFCPEIKLVGVANDIKTGVPLIKERQPDVVFLDIQMPQYAGYEIVDFFTEINFEIVFVTAYDMYAVKAFEVSAVDYLMKPIEIDRLKETVQRIHNKLESRFIHNNYDALIENLKAKEIKRIIIPHLGKKTVLKSAEIYAIEAQESYCYIHLKEERILVSKNLKHFEKVLADLPYFFRTHKSWIINSHYYQGYSRVTSDIKLNNGLTCKLSKQKKKAFDVHLKKYR